eukprot:1160967-Pelagomonas_calceolata.AAC.3
MKPCCVLGPEGALVQALVSTWLQHDGVPREGTCPAICNVYWSRWFFSVYTFSLSMMPANGLQACWVTAGANGCRCKWQARLQGEGVNTQDAVVQGMPAQEAHLQVCMHGMTVGAADFLVGGMRVLMATLLVSGCSADAQTDYLCDSRLRCRCSAAAQTSRGSLAGALRRLAEGCDGSLPKGPPSAAAAGEACAEGAAACPACLVFKQKASGARRRHALRFDGSLPQGSSSAAAAGEACAGCSH